MNSLAESLAQMELLARSEKAESNQYTCRCGTPVRQWRDRCAVCTDKQRKADRALRLGSALASIPKSLRSAHFNGLLGAVDPVLLEVASGWRRENGNLVLLGPSGSGKTVLSVAILRRVLDSVRDAVTVDAGLGNRLRFAEGMRFYSAQDLAVARRYWPLGNGDAPEFHEAKHATLLVLDELGYEAQHDTTIPELIDFRYGRGSLTIATSGRSASELNARYGEAIPRKLVAGGRTVSVFRRAA